MEDVKMFKTSYGKMFVDSGEAIAHEKASQADAQVKRFGDALAAAGFGPEQRASFLRGVRLYRTWQETEIVAPPKKRAAA
jgi:hypothetical protein